MRPGVGGCWVGSMNVMVCIVLLAATYAECDDGLALVSTKYLWSKDIVHTMVTPFLVFSLCTFSCLFVAPCRYERVAPTTTHDHSVKQNAEGHQLQVAIGSSTLSCHRKAKQSRRPTITHAK